MADFRSKLNNYEQKKRKLEPEEATVSNHTRTESGNGSSVRVPHFYVIGAQKCGTMAAVKNLNKHPNIFVANEVHYFDRMWHTKDVRWYAAQFTTDKPVLGEKTPELIYVDECAVRMKEVSPDAKFLLFLREPASRAYSGWNMNRANGRESAPFDECVQRNLKNLDEIRSYGTAEFHYVQRGFYIEQIERFLKVFPDRAKLHVVIAERVRRDPLAEYAKIFDFLGVPRYDFVPEDEHIGSYDSVMGSKVAERLRKIYAPYNERLFQFLGYRVAEWSESTTSNVTAGDARSVPASEATQAKLPGKSKEGIDGGVGCPLLSDAADFAQIGRRHGTDKVTHHGYQRFYPRFIEHYRSLPPGLAMLEIGVDQSHSLRTWLDYFPHAFIYGVDISISKAGDRYRIFKADQSQAADMRRIVERELQHPLFLVVDDGSHVPEHQVACFDLLFQSTALLPGGTYIVEDVETSYWSRGGLYGYSTRYGYHHERSAVEVFKDVLDDVNAEFLTEDNRRAQERRVGGDISAQTRRLISSVTFGQNCIIITKKTREEEAEYGDRPYRFRKNL